MGIWVNPLCLSSQQTMLNFLIKPMVVLSQYGVLIILDTSYWLYEVPIKNHWILPLEDILVHMQNTEVNHFHIHVK